MAVDANVLLLVQVRGLGETALKPLVEGWLYLLEGGSVTVLHTNLRGIALFDGTGTAQRDHWWEFNTTRQVKIGDALKACFSRGARPVPAALLTPDLFSDVKVAVAPPQQIKVPTNAPQNDAQGTPFPLHSLALRLGVVQLEDVGISLEMPTELTLLPLTPVPLPIGDAYYTQGGLQGAAAWSLQATPALINPEFDPNRRGGANAPAVGPSTDIPNRGFKVAGRVGAQAQAVEVSLVGADGNPMTLCEAENLVDVQALSARLDQGAFATEIFLPPDLGGAPVGPSFGLADLIVTVSAAGRKFVDAFAVHLCAVELSLVDDLDQPTQGRGRSLTGSDEQNVVDFSQPHATPNGAAIRALTRSQRMHCYLIRSAFDPTGAQPTGTMPQFMLAIHFVGLSSASLGELGLHRYRRETHGILFPVFGANTAPPPNDGVSRASPRTSVLFQLSWQYRFAIDWAARNSDLQARSYGTVPFVVTGQGRASLRVDGLGAVFGPGLEQLRTSDNVVPLALAAQPTDPARRTPELRIDQPLAFGRHKQETARPSLVVESLPIFTEAPLPLFPNVASLLRSRGQVFPPQPATVPALRGGLGDVSLTQLDVGFGEVENDTPNLVALTTPLVERVPQDPSAQGLDVLVVRTTGPAKVVPPSSPPLALPLIRVAGVNLPQANALALLDRIVRSAIPAAGLFFISQNCWVQTARMTILGEAGGRMLNNGTFVHPTTVKVQGRAHFFGVEAGMPIFGPPNGYGVCQLDPPTNGTPTGTSPQANFGRFDRRLWDYEANIERGVELLVANAQAAFNRFQQGSHYTVVTRRNTFDSKGDLVVNSGTPNRVVTTAAANAWKAIQNTEQGRAILQREVVRSFGGGREFSYFPRTDSWEVWSTPSQTFWVIHVDGKIHPGLLFRRTLNDALEGQAEQSFTAQFFGPAVDEQGAL